MKKEMLKKLKMPEKKSQDPMLEMDEMESPSEDSPEEEYSEMDLQEEQPASPLDEVSDEELFAEFQKRGLKPEDMQAQPSPEEEMPV